MMNIDYAAILMSQYPTKLWGGSGATYDRIIWKDSIPIPQAELDAKKPLVMQEKAFGIAKKTLDDGYAIAAASGFECAALGSPYRYPSAPENQLDIIGSTLIAVVDSTAVIPFGCTEVATGVYDFNNHTAAQWLQVFMAGVMYKQTTFTQYNMKLYGLQGMTVDQLLQVKY